VTCHIVLDSFSSAHLAWRSQSRAHTVPHLLCPVRRAAIYTRANAGDAHHPYPRSSRLWIAAAPYKRPNCINDVKFYAVCVWFHENCACTLRCPLEALELQCVNVASRCALKYCSSGLASRHLHAGECL